MVAFRVWLIFATIRYYPYLNIMIPRGPAGKQSSTGTTFPFILSRQPCREGLVPVGHRSCPLKENTCKVPRGKTRYLSKVPPTVHTYSATPFDFAILPAHFSPCTVERIGQRHANNEATRLTCSLSFGSRQCHYLGHDTGHRVGHLYRSNHITATNACLITNSQNPLVKCIRCLSWYTWLIDTSCGRTLGPSA